MDATVSLICSKCGSTHERAGQRYCVDCHAGYMREWRKDHPLSDESRRRDIARSHANVGKRRGQLIPMPCQKCGALETEMHHPDHELPRAVVWLCRRCHLAWHGYFRAAALEIFLAWLVIEGEAQEVADAGR